MNKIYKTTYPNNICSYSHDIFFLLPEYLYNQVGSEQAFDTFTQQKVIPFFFIIYLRLNSFTPSFLINIITHMFFSYCCEIYFLHSFSCFVQDYAGAYMSRQISQSFLTYVDLITVSAKSKIAKEMQTNSRRFTCTFRQRQTYNFIFA